MSDRNLSELEWKKFAKGKDVKDAAFVKALAALEKAKAPDEQLKALDEIDRQADALRKAGKGDKGLAGWLDDLDRAAQKQRKLSELEAKKQAKAAAEEEEEDESEDETPALLTSKLIPLVRQVRKGDVVLQALIATAGKDTAVLLARRGIAPARRKLLAEYLGVSGGVKYIAGECLFEDNTLVFAVQSQAAGLAKKLKAALYAQCDMRLRVSVRGAEPGDVDEELEEESGEQGEQGETEIEQQGTATDPLQRAFETRLAELEPLLLAALKAQSGDASKLRAVADFAREKGRGGAFKPALQALEQLAKLLAAPPSTTAPPTSSTTGESEGRESETEGDDAGPAFNARLARLMPQIKAALAAGGPAELKTLVAEAGELARKKDFDAANETLDRAERLIGESGGSGGGRFDEAAFRKQWAEAKAGWRDALDTVNGQIAALQSALKKIDDVELHEIAEFGLAGVTGNYKVPMMAAIIEIDQARGGASLRKGAAKAGDIAKAFNAYLASEETVAVCDANEFGVPVTLRASLGKALSGIEAALAAVR